MTEPEPGPDSPDLRRTYRAVQEPGSEACPTPEALAALATGELAGDERQQIADHVVRCRACSENAQILLQAHAESGGRPRAGRLAVIAGLAAAAAVVLVAGRLLLAPGTGPSAERGPVAAVHVAPADGAELTGAPQRFSWPADKDSESYRVKLFDDAGEPLWQSEPTRETAVDLPAPARDRLQPGRAYFWNVEIEGRLEKQHLGPFRFRLSPK